MRYRQVGRYAPLAERFWSKVTRGGPDECWPFQEKARTPHGYGRVWADGRVRPAHAVAYELAHGALPEGTEPHHTCGNPPCCNPAHLEAVTHAENLRRSPLALTVNLAKARAARWAS